MGIFKSAFMLASAAVGGIYLTSEEGKKARISLQKKRSTFEPIIKSLLDEAQSVLEGSKQVNSDEIRNNINVLVDESKKTLLNIKFEDALETIKEAIKVASKKIRIANQDSINPPKKIAKKEASTSKSKTTKTVKKQVTK